MATLRLKSIATMDLPELELYRTLRRPDEHERAGLVVATNDKVVRRLLASRFTVLSLLLTPEWFERLKPALDQRPETIDVYLADKALLEDITGYRLHQGVLAAGRLPQRPSLESILSTSPRPLLLVAIDGVGNAENLGMIVRNCAAFGASALIVGETCGSPYQRRAVAGSMGTLFEQTVVQVENLAATISQLRTRGIRSFAAHPRPDAMKLQATDFGGDCCLVFGAEGPGIRDEVLSACDATVEIPMPSHMNSLNVASASAIFLYEATRQRAISP